MGRIAPLTTEEQLMWEAHKAEQIAAGVDRRHLRRRDFQAGFLAASGMDGRAQSFLKSHRFLQSRNVELNAEVIALRAKLRAQGRSFDHIKRIVDNRTQDLED